MRLPSSAFSGVPHAIGSFQRIPGLGGFHKTSAEMVLRTLESIRQNDDGTPMPRTAHRALLVVFALLLLPAVASAKHARPYAPSEQQSFDAVLTDWTAIAKAPGGKSVFEMQAETYYRAKQQRLLVLEARDVSGERWLKVRLPAWFSHGMTAGWLKAKSVDLRVNRWRVEISRAAGTLKLVHDGRVVRTAHVGTGTNSTPTPAGLHATYDHWRSTHAVLGDWTVSLTTHSPQVPVFDQLSVIVGPALGGLLFAVDPELVYVVSSSSRSRPSRPSLAMHTGRDGAGAGSPDLASVLGGVRLVRRTPVLLGAISLDLFAVLLRRGGRAAPRVRPGRPGGRARRD